MAQFTVNITGEVEDFRQLVGGKRRVNDASMLGGNMGVLNTVGGTVTVSGIPEVIANWDRVQAGIKLTCYEQLIEASALIEIQSSIEAPYLSGQLQSALRRDEEEIHSAGPDGLAPIRVYIYYDSNAVLGEDGGSYAWMQHERMDFQHPTPGTKAKFLEDPFKEVSQLFPELCKDAIVAALPGLGAGTGGPRLRKKT